jgi:hypothetical protein
MATAGVQRTSQGQAGPANENLFPVLRAVSDRTLLHNGRKFTGIYIMRVKQFWQWLIDLADATDGAPIDMPSAEHAFLTGRTVAQYLESLK